MVFGVILAGGIGSRMGNVEKPKQYLNVGGKPIILHTLEKFYVNSKFEKLIVLCPSQWINHTKNLVKKNFNDDSKIVVIEGGSTRNETIMNSIRYIEKEYGLDDDTIIVTHDSVRPFLISCRAADGLSSVPSVHPALLYRHEDSLSAS